jgi:hypothetical protein
VTKTLSALGTSKHLIPAMPVLQVSELQQRTEHYVAQVNMRA